MSRRKIKAGSTSVMLPIFVQDSTATDGSGLGSLVYNTASLAARYRRAGASSWTTITLVTATLGTFTSGGFITSGGVTGSYEVGIPDAALAAGGAWVEIEYYGAANMLPVKIEIELDAVDYQDATAFGLSRLDAAVSADTAGVTTLLSRIIGTIAAGTHNPQGGDAHAYLTTNLGLLGVALSAIPKTGFKLAADGLPTMPSDWISAAGVSAAAVAKIEAALLNEGDGQALINAMVAAIDAADIDADELPALVGAWILNRVLAGNHDTAGTPGKILQDIVAKTVNLPAAPASTTDVTAARDLVLTAVGTPLQAGSYTAPDNAGIANAVTAAGAAATAAGAAQTAAETAATAAAAAATEAEVQAIVDAIKGAGWTTETLKAIFDKPGAELTELQITAIATAVATATITAIGVDGVSVSTIMPAALAAVRAAVAGSVVQSTSVWPKAGYIAPRLGHQYGLASGRWLGATYSATALPWVTAGAAYLDITVGEITITLTGTAAIAAGEITTDFSAVAADWGQLTDGEGTFVAYQIASGERWDIEGGRATVRPKEGP